MVALLSEFVVAPGKTDLVCAAVDIPSSADCACVQTIIASYADAPRRVFVLHVFAGDRDATRFHEDVLPGLVQSVRLHIDLAVPLRKMNIAANTAAALVA